MEARALAASVDISASADRALALATGFWRWWRTELLALIPERLRQLSQRKGQVVLMLGDGSAPATLFCEGTGAPSVLAQFADPTSAEARAAVQAVLRQPEIADLLARDELGQCLRLPSRWALCRTIDLPLAADSNLSEVVGFELDRYTPFRAEQVYFCQRVLARHPATQRLEAEVIVVPRPVIDDALRIADELGWAPERVDVADPSPDAAHSDNLLATATPAVRRDGARATFGLAATAGVLTLAAVAIPFAAAEHRAAAMTEAVAAVEKQAQAAITLQKEIAALRDGEDFLVARKHRSPGVSALLAEVTHLLPDDTSLSEFRISGSDVELTGVAASASALIGILEQSGLFRETSFRSPVTPDPSRGRERFSIATHIVQEHQQ